MGILSRFGINPKKQPKGSVRQRYFGISNLQFRGGVYAPEFPEFHFNVGLIDSSGEVLFSTQANQKSLKAEIPNGFGFTLPVPYEWLSPSDTPRLFQFKILETGEVFPKEPRVLPVHKLLRNQQPENVNINFLPDQMTHLTDVIAELVNEKSLVVGTHNMNRTGAPMIILEIIKHLKERHNCEIILLCLGPRQELFPEFDQHCCLIVENLEDAFKSAKRETEKLFSCLGKSVPRRIALINSMCSTKLAQACNKVGFDVRSLIHEYPYAFEPEWVLHYFNSANGVVFPCHEVYQSYASATESGKLNHSSFSILPQGCYLLEKMPLDKEEADAFSKTFYEQNHLGPDDRLVMACGTIDSRKGFDWFVALIRQYMETSPNAHSTHFVWIGAIGEKELFFHGLHDLRQQGIIGHFHHLDQMGDVRLPIRHADIFLLCSRIDPFPSVVLESFLMGIPVIGFDKGQGCREMIRETGFGMIVPYLNLERTVDAIDDLIENPSKSQRVKDLGPSFIKEHFQYKDYVDNLAGWILNGKTLNKSAATWTDYSLTGKKIELLPPVLLMGFHRSGTSYFSKFLSSIGINMTPSGASFKAGQGNPHGHFEDLRILDFHCELMQKHHSHFMNQWGGQHCIFLPDYSSNWEEFQPEAKALHHELAGSTPWGWKDPRTLLFFKLWDSTFNQSIKILALRHPLEIFLSLLRRNTDPYFYANPLGFFEAYEGYHRDALIDYEAHPDDWHIILSPPSPDSLESLRSFLMDRLAIDLQAVGESSMFNPSLFHELKITPKISKEFDHHFPRTAYIHDRFAGLNPPEPAVNAASPTPHECLEWLESTFASLQADNFSLHQKLKEGAQLFES